VGHPETGYLVRRYWLGTSILSNHCLQGNYDRISLPMYRGGPFTTFWDTFWTDKSFPKGQTKASRRLSVVNRTNLHFIGPRQVIAALEKTLDNSPRIIGHPNSAEYSEVQSGDPDLLRCCQWEQRVAGMNRYFIV
jgi:hypothetical protein